MLSNIFTFETGVKFVSLGILADISLFGFIFNISELNVFNSKNWTIPVRSGDIVIYPGWVNHTTTPNEHETPRVVLGANFFARGKFGKYENTNLIEVK